MTTPCIQSMPRDDLGAVLTHRGHVWRWECDRNHHWNTKFYIRAFQQASEILAVSATGRNPGQATAAVRHVRFLKEIGRDASMVVHSARVAGGAHDGAIIHLMSNGDTGRLSATALDRPGYPADAVPAIPYQRLPAPPTRGLADGPHAAIPQDGGGDVAEYGPLSAGEFDHAGGWLAQDLLAKTTAASHFLLNRIGFTPEWISRTNRNRMAVETKTTRFGSCGPGDPMRVVAGIGDVRRSTFVTHFRIEHSGTGDVVAVVEQLLVVVDLETRRSVTIPDFVHSAAARSRPT